jgi:hypothetical protein
MAEAWNINSLINHLNSIPKDYDQFMDGLLGKCWELRTSKKNENDKALNVLYDFQCGYYKFKTNSTYIAKVFNDFFEDIARCGPDCINYLYFDPCTYLNEDEKIHFNKVISGLIRIDTANNIIDASFLFPQILLLKIAASEGPLDGRRLYEKEEVTRTNILKYLYKPPQKKSEKHPMMKIESTEEIKEAKDRDDS